MRRRLPSYMSEPAMAPGGTRPMYQAGTRQTATHSSQLLPPLSIDGPDALAVQSLIQARRRRQTGAHRHSHSSARSFDCSRHGEVDMLMSKTEGSSLSFRERILALASEHESTVAENRALREMLQRLGSLPANYAQDMAARSVDVTTSLGLGGRKTLTKEELQRLKSRSSTHLDAAKQVSSKSENEPLNAAVLDTMQADADPNSCASSAVKYTPVLRTPPARVTPEPTVDLGSVDASIGPTTIGAATSPVHSANNLPQLPQAVDDDDGQFVPPPNEDAMTTASSKPPVKSSNTSVSADSMVAVMPTMLQSAGSQRRSSCRAGSRRSMASVEQEQWVHQWYDRGVMSPVWPPRMAWDLVWCFCCFVEVCWVPFATAYPSQHIDVAARITLMVFFGLDMLMNMSTGYTQRGVSVMQRKRVVRKYLTSWFWLDLVAWIPLSLMSGAAVPDINAFARLAKAPKVVSSLGQWGWLTDNVQLSNGASTILKVIVGPLALLSFLAHIHGCMRTALGVDEYRTEYFQAILDSFLELTLQMPIVFVATPTFWTQLYQICMSVERVGLVCVAVSYLSRQVAMLYSKDDVHMEILQENAMRYIKRNAVSPETLTHVSDSLQQARQFNMAKRHFNTITMELPPSLHRQLCKEMWERSLTTLQLIEQTSKWSKEFLPELVMLVEEEEMAPQMVVFEQDDACHDAFFIIQGTLHCPANAGVPDFTAGMWVGETALINSNLCPGLTIATKTKSRLLVVPAEEFQTLICSLNIREVFKNFCQNKLFRGMCGRCGSIGEHMSDECPHQALLNSEARELCRDLKAFLRKYGLEELTGTLIRLSVFNTDQLLELVDVDNMDFLRQTMKDSDEIEDYTALEKCMRSALNEETILRFQKKLYATIKRTVNHGGPLLAQHLAFLSHYKVEAGTEATLMRSEIEQTLMEDDIMNGIFDVPVFLDSEDLMDLELLHQNVCRSHNVLLLLTKDVLKRPWCLVEIVTAWKSGIPIVPVEIVKPGESFKFPDQAWYSDLLQDKVLGQADIEVLTGLNVDLPTCEKALKAAFKSIALRYSPHRSADIRRVEIQAIVQRCTWAFVQHQTMSEVTSENGR